MPMAINAAYMKSRNISVNGIPQITNKKGSGAMKKNMLLTWCSISAMILTGADISAAASFAIM